MKLKSLLATGILCLTAMLGLTTPDAKAFTVDELMQWDGYCIENVKSTRFDRPVKWLSSSVETKFEKVSDTEIRLTGMFDDEYSFTFKLANGYTRTSNGTVSTNGTQLVLSGSNLDCNNKYNYHLLSTIWEDGDYTGDDSWNVVGTITKVDDDNMGRKFKIVFPSFALYSGSLDWINTLECYDGYELEIYEPNAWIYDDAIDYAQGINTQRDRKYRGRIDYNSDGTFTLIGLAKWGYRISSSNQLIPFNGQYDPTDLSQGSYIEKGHVLFGEDNYNDNFVQWTDYDLYMVDDYGNLYYGVDGTFDSNDYQHKGSNTWVTNDGDCSTEYGRVMNINDFVAASTNSIQGRLLTTPTFENTRIESTEDYTHSVSLKVNSFKRSKDKQFVEISASITPLANTDHVASYDLFLVEGNHSSILCDHFNGKLHGEKGHEDAILLTGAQNYTESPAKAPIAQGAQQSINLRIPSDNIPKKGISGEGYTMFIRTNYSAANLEPTFHDMQMVESLITGIDGIEDDAAAEYFSLQGVRIDEPSKGQVVIRRQGTKSEKVVF